MNPNKLINIILAASFAITGTQGILAQTSNITYVAPTEKIPFVTDLGAQPAPKGLDGKNIAMWQSHGFYFEPKLNRWEWQRDAHFLRQLKTCTHKAMYFRF